MKYKDVIFITQTDKRAVYVCIVTIFLFTSIISIMRIQTSINNSTYYFMVTFFSLFIIAAFVELFKFKEIVLTKTELKIIFPFIFKAKCYSIQNIETIEEKDYKIEPLVGKSRTTLHEGKETIIKFKTASEVLAFNTIETNDYFEFIKIL